MRPLTLRSSLAMIACTSLFVLAPASIGHADDDGKAGEVSIQAEWKVGDQHRYERVKTRRRLMGGKETSRGSGTGTIDLSVVEAGEKGFLVRWRIGESTPDDPKAAANPVVRAMNQLYEGLTIDIEFDREAMITGVRNWAELKKSSSKLIDALIEAQKAAGVDVKTLASVRPTVEALFATKEKVEQSFLKEPQLLFMPIGRVYSGVGQSLEYDDLLPNPLGGPPLPSKGVITLTSHDPDKGRAVVTWTQTMDPKETARIMRESLKSAFPRLGRTPPKADEFDSFMVKDHAEFVIDTKNGWVEQVTHTRSTTIQESTTEDILSMTRKTKPE